MGNDIQVQKRKLSEVLFNHRYKIDVFQREYKWQETQIEALINDLTTSFYKSYKDGDTIESYESYDNYFMGSIVLCQDKRKNLSIVDGQQRLTTFTLLLIFLAHLQEELKISEEYSKDMDQFFFIKKGGQNSLILNIESRAEVMNLLITEPRKIYEDYDVLMSQPESIRNIVKGYMTIGKFFSDDLVTPDRLPLFIEWLLDNVMMVEILTDNIDNAYTIFETMNDRGLNLRPAEILKGYLLSKIVETHEPEDERKAEEANKFWTERLEDMQMKQCINESDFFRAWLRAKYAVTQRSTKSGAVNEDFEKIGTNFHSWVKDNTSLMKLKSPNEYYFFIRSDFDFYSSLYMKISQYKQEMTDRQELLYINNFWTIADSLAYPLLMSPVTKIDDTDTIEQKLRTVAVYIDKLANIRTLQNRAITQTSVRNLVYELVKRIRNAGLSSVEEILSEELSKNSKDEELMRQFQGMRNINYCHYFYARIWHHISPAGDFAELLRSRKQTSYIMVPIFSADDFTHDDKNPLTTILPGSIANYCLMRRRDAKAFESISVTEDKIKFVLSKNIFPELDGMDLTNKTPFEIIEQRDFAIRNYARQIWA